MAPTGRRHTTDAEWMVTVMTLLGNEKEDVVRLQSRGRRSFPRNMCNIALF
jgi:hypothetical protein